MLCRVEDIEIWRALESVTLFRTPAQLYPNTPEPELIQQFKAHAPRQLCADTGRMLLPVQSFVLKVGTAVVLIDACVGNHKTVPGFEPWHMQSGTRFLSALAAADVTVNDVTHVMCTHLHTDHTGWNTQLKDGRWVPTFPNATYLFQETEHAHYQAENSMPYQENVLPVVAAGLAEFVTADYGMDFGLSLIPTPGHTPGHVSINLRDQALITGDALHSPAQVFNPDWDFVFDLDADQARKSRHRFLKMAADSGARILGSHFPLPSTGHVTQDTCGYCWHGHDL